MQFMHSYQRIVLKGIFISFMTIACLFSALPASAIQIPEINGSELLQDFTSGDISLSEATSQLSQAAGIPTGNASEILQNMTGIDITAGGELLDGLVEGNIDLTQLNELGDMLENIQDELLDPSMITDLLENVAEGLVPPEIGEFLSGLEALEQLTDIESLTDLINSPEILGELEEMLDLGALPSEITEALDAITEIVSEIEALPETIAAAIVESLPSELVEALGGEEALTGILSGLLGSTGTADTPEEGDLCTVSCDACKDCAPNININHRRIRAHVTSEFEQHRNWFVTNFFLDTIAPAMARMTSQLATASMQRMQIIGSFFDAEHQLKTQRLFQKLTAQAHKDYHPSQALCEIGTNFRALESSKKHSELAHTTLANRMMARQLLNGDGLSSRGSKQDRNSRMELFIRKFCNKTDHAGGLQKLCKDGGKSLNQINLDIDYTNTIDNKLTLEVNFTDESSSTPTEDEENVFALSSNLFANEVLPAISDSLLIDSDGDPTENVNHLLNLRAIAAKRSVAQNSFAAITAMKAESHNQSAPFLKAILLKSGVEPEDIEERLGKNPSLDAQQEILTKDLLRNPEFYSNLYDKPANIERTSASLLALELIQDRNIYKSLLRSEAVLATMVEVLIQKEHDRVKTNLDNINTLAPKMKQSGGG